MRGRRRRAITSFGLTVGGGIGAMYLAYDTPKSATPPPGTPSISIAPHTLPRGLLTATRPTATLEKDQPTAMADYVTIGLVRIAVAIVIGGSVLACTAGKRTSDDDVHDNVAVVGTLQPLALDGAIDDGGEPLPGNALDGAIDDGGEPLPGNRGEFPGFPDPAAVERMMARGPDAAPGKKDDAGPKYNDADVDDCGAASGPHSIGGTAIFAALLAALLVVRRHGRRS